MSALDPDIHYSDLPHVLVIDDDDRIRSLAARYLNEHGFLALGASNAQEAEKMLRVSEFDALVVDVMMPGKSGLDFMQELRMHDDIPAIMLTALGEVDDRLHGFDAGADDYLPKPFEPKELVARLKALIRRRPAKRAGEAYRVGTWSFDPVHGELLNGDESVKLTDVEAKLLQVLLQKQGQVLSRQALAKLCDVGGEGERTIDVQVTRLRRKIEEDSKNPRHILTLRGKGYMLRVDEA